MHFKSLNLIVPIIRAVTEAGYSKPTGIQAQGIPPILEGKDVIGYAPTGTGKTAAFALPILQMMKKKSQEHKDIRALIITATREHALQMEADLQRYSKYLPLSQLSIIEGVSEGSQISALRNRVEVLIATPDRLLEMYGRGHINLSRIEVVVFDDADRLLETGLGHQIKDILKLTPQKKQTLVFSATKPPAVTRLADSILNNPMEITVGAVSTADEIIKQPARAMKKNNRPDYLSVYQEPKAAYGAAIFPLGTP